MTALDRAGRLALTIAALIVGATPTFAEPSAKHLSGGQIQAKFIGKQLTDEVHYRFVFEKGGTLRSYAMGAKKIGRWSIDRDEICLTLGERDDGCYRVSLSGSQIELTPSGIGGPIDGILQPVDVGTGHTERTGR